MLTAVYFMLRDEKDYHDLGGRYLEDRGVATQWGSFANRRYEIDATNRDNWTAIAEWLHKTINDYRGVLESPPAPPLGDLPHG